MKIILFLLAFIGPVLVSAQGFTISGSASFGFTNFLFKDKDEAFVNVKTSAVATYEIQSGIQFMLSPSFGMGLGLGYLKMKGTTNPVYVDSRLSNPNATGNFTVDVNSSYLHIPIQFTVVLTQSWKVRPQLITGLNLYVPLEESYVGKITPENPNPFYPLLQTEITEGKEVRGFLVGLGALIPIATEKDLNLTFFYRINSLTYDFQIVNVITEQRVMKFNTWELTLGFPLVSGRLKTPSR